MTIDGLERLLATIYPEAPPTRHRLGATLVYRLLSEPLGGLLREAESVPPPGDSEPPATLRTGPQRPKKETPDGD